MGIYNWIRPRTTAPAVTTKSNKNKYNMHHFFIFFNYALIKFKSMDLIQYTMIISWKSLQLYCNVYYIRTCFFIEKSRLTEHNKKPNVKHPSSI